MSHGLHELLRRMTCYRVQHTAELGRGPSMKTIGRHCTHGDQGVGLGSASYIARHLHAWHDCKTPLCVASPIQQCSRLPDALHPNLIISPCARSCTLLASYPSRACIAAKQSVTCQQTCAAITFFISKGMCRNHDIADRMTAQAASAPPSFFQL